MIGFFHFNLFLWASVVAQLVKNPPAMCKTWVRSLGWDNPLKKAKATQPSVRAWRIPWTVQTTGLQGVGHDWETLTLACAHRKAQHTTG